MFYSRLSTLVTPNGARWHSERRRQLLRAHPEVRNFVGRNAWSALFVFVLVASLLLMAFFLRHQPWWFALVVAYAIGTFFSHALGVLIHECAHDLVFKLPVLNKLLAMVANAPLIFPAAIDFRDKHLKHHAHLGEPDGADTQAPTKAQYRFVTSRFRAVLWHCFAPIFIHSGNFGGNKAWRLANTASQIIVSGIIILSIGWVPLFFLAASGWFAFGAHPVGLRRYAEHLIIAPGQPTTSYYGFYNLLSFDVGYHVEHHDLPSVPWNKLRQLRALAPELYGSLTSAPSWSVLLVRLFTNPGEGPEKYYRSDETMPIARAFVRTQSPAGADATFSMNGARPSGA